MGVTTRSVVTRDRTLQPPDRPSVSLQISRAAHDQKRRSARRGRTRGSRAPRRRRARRRPSTAAAPTWRAARRIRRPFKSKCPYRCSTSVTMEASWRSSSYGYRLTTLTGTFRLRPRRSAAPSLRTRRLLSARRSRSRAPCSGAYRRRGEGRALRLVCCNRTRPIQAFCIHSGGSTYLSSTELLCDVEHGVNVFITWDFARFAALYDMVPLKWHFTAGSELTQQET